MLEKDAEIINIGVGIFILSQFTQEWPTNNNKKNAHFPCFHLFLISSLLRSALVCDEANRLIITARKMVRKSLLL